MGRFVAIAAGALIFLLTNDSTYSGDISGSIFKPGIGLGLCLICGLAGLGLLTGIIKIPDNKPPATLKS